MKILVLGSNGQLALCLKDEIKNSKDEFIFLNKKDLDITNPFEVNHYFEKFNPSIVINCAAYTNVDMAEQEKEQASLINGSSLNLISERCLVHQSFLIHISTDYVFDGLASSPYKESDKVCPQSSYGRSKLLGEKAIQNSGCKYLIIRSSWIFSEYGNNFLKTILNLANKKNSLNVVNDQYGCPTYASDLSKAILKVIYFIREKQVKSGIYHFCGDTICSWYDFATKIISHASLTNEIVPVSFKNYPSKTKRPNYSVMNCSKFIKDFDFKIPNLESSIKKVIGKLGT